MPYVANDLIYVSAGYPPTQPIFAIKTGLRGQGRGQGRAQPGGLRVEDQAGRSLHPHHRGLWRPALHRPEQRCLRLLQREDRRAALPEPDQHEALARTPLRSWPATGRSTWPPRMATSSWSRPGPPSSFWPPIPVGEVLMATPAITERNAHRPGPEPRLRVRDRKNSLAPLDLIRHIPGLRLRVLSNNLTNYHIKES